MNGLTVPFLLVGQSWNIHLVISVEDKRGYRKYLNASIPNPHEIIEACSSLECLQGQALLYTGIVKKEICSNYMPILSHPFPVAVVTGCEPGMSRVCIHTSFTKISGA